MFLDSPVSICEHQKKMGELYKMYKQAEKDKKASVC